MKPSHNTFDNKFPKNQLFSGIGKETVKEMAKRGATVYMACRDIARCQEVR